MTNWDEGAGRASRAFDDWRLVEGDQRAFLALGQRFAESGYQFLGRRAAVLRPRLESLAGGSAMISWDGAARAHQGQRRAGG